MRDLVDELRAAGCVFAEQEARLLMDAAISAAQLRTLVDRRVSGEPLEYVLGWAEFHGLRLAVEPGVFVPRHRTELLVDVAIDILRSLSAPIVVDLCCGTGAIAAAIAATLADVRLHAADLDPVAVRCAQRNLRCSVYQGDLFDALPDELRGRIDVLVMNAPYVPTDEIALMPTEAREYEARVALDGGRDGTAVQRRVIATAPSWLASQGCLLTETSERQAPLLVDALAAAGLQPEVVTSDDSTVVIGRSAA